MAYNPTVRALLPPLCLCLFAVPSGARAERPLGALCGRTAQCRPLLWTGNDTVTDNPDWPGCADAQCASGLCLEPTCSKRCRMTKDTLNWWGDPEPDGVEDPDTARSDCAGAVAGPMGASFMCVSATRLVSWCLGGTTFEPCRGSTDCALGESCQLHYILGRFTARCAAAPTHNPARLGQPCNADPARGALALCDSGLCTGYGCTGFCVEDRECMTAAAGCFEGTCLTDPHLACTTDTDCSAFECRTTAGLFGPEGPHFDLCMGKGCTRNRDCPIGTHCALSGVDGSPSPICAADPVGAARLGEPCSDGPGGRPCAGFCLPGGVCSVLCDDDADCEEAAGMRCLAVSVDGDAPFGLCVGGARGRGASR